MKAQASALSILALLSTSAIFSQSVPIYQVTVTERTVKAVNYEYRRGPTRVDFRGTVLLPDAKGDAVVESKAGRTEVSVKFDRVLAPSRYGGEYLTYVLWAITPEGHAKNLGEMIADGGDHARLHVTTDLQAFGMIVTAEPYAAVRQPSDVVVMENEIRPDTAGKVELIQAKYELLPRGQYTYVKPRDVQPPPESAKISMDQYETLLEVYQAQNAVQIARAQGADRLAADTLAKAEDLLRQARDMQSRRADRSTVIALAREAAQTAEDARAIQWARKHDQEIADARRAADQEQARRIAAEQAARQARIEQSADRAMLEEERAARLAAVASAPAVAPVPTPEPVVVVVKTPRNDRDEARMKSELRMQMFRDLNRILPTTDTPRGLVITINDAAFRNGRLEGDVAARLAAVSTLLAERSDLSVQVDGHMDTAGARAEEISYERAAAVRDALRRSAAVRGLGNQRPLASNSTATGRLQNRRVEIVVSGDCIGSVPHWDHTYSLK
jgi:flagellar motor protein MotB